MESEAALVGYLEVRLKGSDVNGESMPRMTSPSALTLAGTPDLIDIYGNEQFYLGRNASLW